MITLVDQVRCVEREIQMRQRVYPRRVADGRMTQAEADRELATMRAVLDTIRAYANPQPRLKL